VTLPPPPQFHSLHYLFLIIYFIILPFIPFIISFIIDFIIYWKLGGRGKCHKPERDENEESEGNGQTPLSLTRMALRANLNGPFFKPGRPFSRFRSGAPQRLDFSCAEPGLCVGFKFALRAFLVGVGLAVIGLSVGVGFSSGRLFPLNPVCIRCILRLF